MSKALMIAKLLQDGQAIDRYKEAGNSMLPLIKSNQPVRLEPIGDTDLKVNDIVFCKVNGRFFTHKILKKKGNLYQIGNNRGFVNGWIPKTKIFGIVTVIWNK